MPVKSEAYWSARSGKQGTTWYLDMWLDWYMDVLWKVAFRRLGVSLWGKRCIDCGCGDGKYSHYLACRGALSVLGVDFFDYRPVPAERVRFRAGVDLERLSGYGLGHFELALVSSVLECVSDWRRTLQEVMKVADEVVLIEDIREVVPSYQRGLDYKMAFTWREFQEAVSESEFRIVRWLPVNVLDRALWVRAPRPLRPAAIAVTLALDLLLVRLPLVWRYTRFRAVYLRRYSCGSRRRHRIGAVGQRKG